MGRHTMRQLYLLIGCFTFVVLVLNRSNPDGVWHAPAYLEYMFEHVHLHPPTAPHRKLQFGLLETVRTHRLGTLSHFRILAERFRHIQNLKSRHPLLDLVEEGERKWRSMVTRCLTTVTSFFTPSDPV